MSDPSTTILCIHTTPPRPFLTRLLTPSSPYPSSQIIIPWKIQNKYYTADIHFRLLDILDETSKPNGEDVIIFLFDETLTNLPERLGRILDSGEYDISLAVRVNSSSGSQRLPGDEGDTKLQEMFEEIGMEFVDESELPEEDDERPIDVYERIRQTLQTHLWPNMVRTDPSNDGTISTNSDTDEEDTTTSNFPVTFDPISAVGGADTSKSAFTTTETVKEEGFPDLEELKAQVLALELRERAAGLAGQEEVVEGDDSNGAERLEAMAKRLEMAWADEDDDDDLDVGDDFGPTEEEYTRLDDWLELDEPIPEGLDSHYEQADLDTEGEVVEIPTTLPAVDDTTTTTTTEEEFEDDFADFQTSPPPPLLRSNPGRGDTTGIGIPLDPTPLLIHLQNVRADLGGISDEDERRVRAGREVLEVMRSLGLGGSGDEFGLEDLDGLDGLEMRLDDRI